MRKVYHRIDNIAGNVIILTATDAAYGELASVTSTRGTSLAQVIRLEGDRVYLQVFAGSRGIATDAQVRFLGKGMEIPFSEHLLGRIFDGAGRPRDRGPEIRDNPVPIGGPPVNPIRRVIPRHMVRTGIPMIDIFNTLVESQKLPIFSSAGEPYNPLLARIALQAEVDIIVLGGMGLKHDDYLYFRDHLEEHGALSRSVLYIHTAAEPTVEALLVPDVSLAVAEQFALDGKRVLVLLTDMTNFADAMKEIAITMEQIPSNRGYPGDLYSQLAARYEKAVDFDGAGSITVLAVTSMPGDDVTHPVPDNTGYITEGQFYLRGGRIEPFGSLSRLKQQVNNKTRSDHRTIMNIMIQHFASYRETLEKQAMGFRMSGWDRKLLKYGRRFEKEMMDLSVNLPLEKALDLGWAILADSFTPEETGIQSALIREYWPSKKDTKDSSKEPSEAESEDSPKPDSKEPSEADSKKPSEPDSEDGSTDDGKKTPSSDAAKTEPEPSEAEPEDSPKPDSKEPSEAEPEPTDEADEAPEAPKKSGTDDEAGAPEDAEERSGEHPKNENTQGEKDSKQ